MNEPMPTTVRIAQLVDLWDRLQSIRALQASFEPWFSLVLFIAGSLIMIWRLGAMERKGLEGTVLGTLVMPYASGFSNLSFAYVLGRSAGNGVLVLENCLVNNVTNLTLLIGLPALIWSLNLFPERSRGWRGYTAKTCRLNYLSLLLTLIAALFFGGTLWALSRDGLLDFSDGLVLGGVFLFWQIFHVFDVLKNNVHRGRSLEWTILADMLLVVGAGWTVYIAIEGLVAWIPREGTGFFVFKNIGWLSGFLMVLPNALSAFYYAFTRRADIVYSSQIGDGHICIPMCIGLFALFARIPTPQFLDFGLLLIAGAGLAHFLFIALFGRLPRFMGFGLTAAYGLFIYRGLL